MKLCPKCNNEVNENAMFCGKCGYKFQGEEINPSNMSSVAETEKECSNKERNSNEVLKLRILLGANNAVLCILLSLWCFLPFFQIGGSSGISEKGSSLVYYIFYALLGGISSRKSSFSILSLILLLFPIIAIMISGIFTSNIYKKEFLTRKHHYALPVTLVAATCIYSIIMTSNIKSGNFLLGIGYEATYAEAIFVVFGIISIALMVLCSKTEIILMETK